jgi:hypothetical protein
MSCLVVPLPLFSFSPAFKNDTFSESKKKNHEIPLYVVVTREKKSDASFGNFWPICCFEK